MELPKFTTTNLKERIGVSLVQYRCAQMSLIFRETSNSDTGIDGQIEEVNQDGNATGRILAVQIKSGDSYLHDSGNNWIFYTDEAHKNYWKAYPIPVILLVYRPSDDNIYFVDIKYTLNVKEKIEIPKSNILNEENKDELFKTMGGSILKYDTIEDVYNQMLITKGNTADFPVSYLELFVCGLTNLCTDIFVDSSLALDIAHTKTPYASIEDDFFWNYTLFLIKEGLAEVNFNACLYDYEIREDYPKYIAHLTFRGRQLVDYIGKLQDELTTDENYYMTNENLIDIRFDYFSAQKLKGIKILFEKQSEKE